MTHPAVPETILALETATARMSVALWVRGEIRAEREAEGGGRAAERLLELVEQTLEEAALGIGEVAGYAVSVGPGSFTGLRVGLATVKGLAFQPARPVAAVPTLGALAAAVLPQPVPVVALLDAQRGEVYAARYAGSGSPLAPEEPEGRFLPEDLAARLAWPCRLVGEGAPAVAAALATRLGAPVELGEGLPRWPHAREVARLGAELFAAGRGLEAAELVPRYGRRAEAEARRLARRPEPGGTL